MDANQLVKVYIKIRDAKYAKERQMEEEIANLEQQLEVVEHELLEICKATGQDGGKTQYGSFTRSVQSCGKHGRLNTKGLHQLCQNDGKEIRVSIQFRQLTQTKTTTKTIVKLAG